MTTKQLKYLLEGYRRVNGVRKNDRGLTEIMSSIDIFKNSDQIIIRPVRIAGDSKHRHYEDFSFKVKKILNDCQIKFIIDNDSPRKGALGSIIIINLNQ